LTAQSDEPPFVAMVRRHNWWGSSSCPHTYPSRPNPVPSAGVPVPTARDLPGESYSKDQMLKMKPPIDPGRLPSPRWVPGAHSARLARRVLQQGPDAQNEDSNGPKTATEPSTGPGAYGAGYGRQHWRVLA
jgi:hypothetical protein